MICGRTCGLTLARAFLNQKTSNAIQVSQSLLQNFCCLLSYCSCPFRCCHSSCTVVFSPAQGRPSAYISTYMFLSAFPCFAEYHGQQDLNPSPVTLLKDLQEWTSRMPESDLSSKVKSVEKVSFELLYWGHLCIGSLQSHISDLEKQYLRSFAQFFVDFYEREGIKPHLTWPGIVDNSLAVLHTYLDQT